MKKIILVLSILLSGLSVNAQKIEMEALTEKLNKQSLLIDVRNYEEYKRGTILGAINVNVQSDDFRKTFENLEKDREIILFCQTGERSNQTLEKLKSLGFKNVSLLAGGYENWNRKKAENRSK